MRTRNNDSVGDILGLIVILLAIGGWIVNLVKLMFNTGDIDQIVRLVGVIIAPIGAIMGWF